MRRSQVRLTASREPSPTASQRTPRASGRPERTRRFTAFTSTLRSRKRAAKRPATKITPAAATLGSQSSSLRASPPAVAPPSAPSDSPTPPSSTSQNPSRDRSAVGLPPGDQSRSPSNPHWRQRRSKARPVRARRTPARTPRAASSDSPITSAMAMTPGRTASSDSRARSSDRARMVWVRSHMAATGRGRQGRASGVEPVRPPPPGDEVGLLALEGQAQALHPRLHRHRLLAAALGHEPRQPAQVDGGERPEELAPVHDALPVPKREVVDHAGPQPVVG